MNRTRILIIIQRVLMVRLLSAGSTYYTRGCISDILQSSLHRLQMPTVRRHGYCVNGRNYEMMKAQGVVLGTDYIQYCFCNDWNGCNAALPAFAPARLALLLPPAVVLLLHYFHIWWSLLIWWMHSLFCSPLYSARDSRCSRSLSTSLLCRPHVPRVLCKLSRIPSRIHYSL